MWTSVVVTTPNITSSRIDNKTSKAFSNFLKMIIVFLITHCKIKAIKESFIT